MYIRQALRRFADEPLPSGLIPDDGHLELSELATQNGAVQISRFSDRWWGPVQTGRLAGVVSGTIALGVLDAMLVSPCLKMI